jgi:hypothetical protein
LNVTSNCRAYPAFRAHFCQRFPPRR